jgi:hypothetical protein
VIMSAVSETTVVAARCAASAASPATATGTKNEACDHYDNDYRHNYEKHFHPISPFTNSPDTDVDLAGRTRPL